MAPLGLEAARHYAKIASQAPHALHMPSHIFARLGLWDEDIRSNLASAAACEQPEVAHGAAENLLHALDFLQYAYLQLGEEERAVAITREAAAIHPGDFSAGIARYYSVMEADFPAHLALETGNWPAARALQPPAGSDQAARRLIYWAQAVGAGHLMDAVAASRAQARLRATYTAAELAGMKPTIWRCGRKCVPGRCLPRERRPKQLPCCGPRRIGRMPSARARWNCRRAR
jgi:hypothetical protein